MARLPYLTKEDLAPEDQPLLDRDINLFKALAHNPRAARAFSHLGGHIRNKSELNGRLRELAILQVGYLARSAYEYAHHIKIGYAFGVTDADIEGMIAETEGQTSSLDPLSALVIRAAREMTVDGAASEDTFTQLQTQMGNDMVLELLMAIAFYNGVVRILGSLQIDVEPDYMQYLERHPLPE